jgi:hypothetical protein
VVWEQPADGCVEGLADPFVLLTVRADSSGTVGEFSGHSTEAAARSAARVWLGSDREVPLEKVPYSAFNWLFTGVTGRAVR